jgi:hypothetical protein
MTMLTTLLDIPFLVIFLTRVHTGA